jgi:hypothetical protein
MKGEHVPTVGGHIILQHWSNGNSKWSGGPPTSDALLAVSYVKAYFNSSDPQRRISQEELCKDAPSGDEDECAIPDATVEDVLYGGRFLLDGQNGSTVADDEQGHHDEEDSLAVSWSVGAPMGLVMLMLAAAALA